MTADTFTPGRFFVRRERQGDPGDVVRVVGVMPKYAGSEFIENRLVVESATFAAIPEAWDDARVLYPVDDFAAEYAEMAGAERAMLAAEQAIAAKEATEASADRVSPWAYTPPPARRTTKGARS